MTVTSAIVHESYADRIFRRMVPFGVFAVLTALILSPGLIYCAMI